MKPLNLSAAGKEVNACDRVLTIRSPKDPVIKISSNLVISTSTTNTPPQSHSILNVLFINIVISRTYVQGTSEFRG